MTDENGKEYMDCVVANIIGPHYYGNQKEIRYGTRHFRPGAKVYCVFAYGGTGHEEVRVMGKPRKQHRMIDVVVRTKHLKNLRAGRAYDARVLAFLKKYKLGVAYSADYWVKLMRSYTSNGHCEIKLPQND